MTKRSCLVRLYFGVVDEPETLRSRNLFCDSCLCCGLVVRISFACCGDMVVDIGVCLILVFADVAFPSVRKVLCFPNRCNDRF